MNNFYLRKICSSFNSFKQILSCQIYEIGTLTEDSKEKEEEDENDDDEDEDAFPDNIEPFEKKRKSITKFEFLKTDEDEIHEKSIF